ncbi:MULTISPECIES: hypothetical protein [Kribbella]
MTLDPTDAQQLQAAHLVKQISDRHAGRRDYGMGDGWVLGILFDQVGLNIDSKRWATLQLVRANCLCDEVTSRAMDEAWVLDNSPEALIPASEWLEAFGATGYLSDWDDPVPQPTSTMTVYRGAPVDRRCGLAWSEERDVAQVFADDASRRELPSAIFVADVEPWRVKARYRSRSESEVIVDTRGLIMASEGQDDLEPC